MVRENGMRHRALSCQNRLAIGVLLVSLLPAQSAVAQIYKYVDERGHQVYVDSLSKVPLAFRDQLEMRKGGGGPASDSPAQQASRAERERTRLYNTQRRKLEQLLRESETVVRVGNNRVVVPVTVVYGGRKARTEMVLDTGATNTVFHKDALADLSYVTQPAGRARVAGGGTINTEAVSFDRIEIGPYKTANVRAMVIDHQGASVGNDGLLGMDFLMNVRYRIDYDRQLILWEPDRYQQLETLLRQLDEEASGSKDPAPAD
jgi:clan AA aspartic protease (TIGR02281 family)